ncbi:MAG: response regulator transcription factor, partial [Rubrobacteraceae bacterium]
MVSAMPKAMLRGNQITAAQRLSPRERGVDLVARALSTREVSRPLHISEYTVQGHLSNVFEKVGVRSCGEFLKRLFYVCSSRRSQLTHQGGR